MLLFVSIFDVVVISLALCVNLFHGLSDLPGETKMQFKRWENWRFTFNKKRKAEKNWERKREILWKITVNDVNNFAVFVYSMQFNQVAQFYWTTTTSAAAAVATVYRVHYTPSYLATAILMQI